MKPMEPMKPMDPMKPMEPLHTLKPWWNEDLGSPDSAGGQNDVQYAYFANARRLLIKRGESVTAYNSGDHRIYGVAQSSHSAHLTFTSDQGDVDVATLHKLDEAD